MTCQECELALAGEEASEAAGLHLAGCAACREFARDLGENWEIFAAFGAEALAVERTPAISLARPRAVQWQWAAAIAAIAALLVLAFMGSHTKHPSAPKIANVPAAGVQVASIAPRAAVETAAVAAPVRHRSPRPSQPIHNPKILQIKMLTDDPNVVIYWQVEN